MLFSVKTQRPLNQDISWGIQTILYHLWPLEINETKNFSRYKTDTTSIEKNRKSQNWVLKTLPKEYLKSFLPDLNESRNIMHYQDIEYCKGEKSRHTFLT